MNKIKKFINKYSFVYLAVAIACGCLFGLQVVEAIKIYDGFGILKICLFYLFFLIIIWAIISFILSMLIEFVYFLIRKRWIKGG